MGDKDTVIVVAKTELDGYGNLWVSPQGGEDAIKIAQKRESLHPLFQQGKAVLLHWEVYKNRPYVSDASLVEGELPPAQKPITPETGDIPPSPPAPQEKGMFFKELGECIRSGDLEKDFPQSFTRIKAKYYKRMSEVTGIAFWDKQEKEG